eukprot:364649-Chlamydomonas_euryale.AAC.10
MTGTATQPGTRARDDIVQWSKSLEHNKRFLSQNRVDFRSHPGAVQMLAKRAPKLQASSLSRQVVKDAGKLSSGNRTTSSAALPRGMYSRGGAQAQPPALPCLRLARLDSTQPPRPTQACCTESATLSSRFIAEMK